MQKKNCKGAKPNEACCGPIYDKVHGITTTRIQNLSLDHYLFGTTSCNDSASGSSHGSSSFGPSFVLLSIGNHHNTRKMLPVECLRMNSHVIKLRYITYFLAIICAGNSFAADQNGLSYHAKQLLEAPNFRLVSRIKGLKSEVSILTDEIVAQEFYSNKQKRARIELYNAYRDATSGQSSSARSIYYHNSKQLIRHTSQKGKPPKCVLSDSKELGTDLFYAALRGEEIDGIDWLQKKDDIPDHVIGTACYSGSIASEVLLEKLSMAAKPPYEITMLSDTTS